MFVSLVVAAALTAAPASDVPEPGAREAIAAATTEPRFLSPWVSDVPDSATVPSPTKFLGHIAGAPGELTRTDRMYAYYRALAKATPRVKVETIGTSEEGREILLVFVGSEENIARLEELRRDTAALADPRKTDEAAMERIVASTAPLYMLHGGLHSNETGSPEMLMELAYRLAVSNASPAKEIRQNVVVVINPCAEPDGRDKEVDWFYRHLKGKTDFDRLPPKTPPFWGKYVLHDNNRDGIQRKLALTRATQDAFLKWHPVVLHDLHESIPLLTIWTGTGPYNANVDPITAVEIQALAFHEVTTLTSFGMPGVWSWGFGEGWSQFYADSVATNHNAIGKGYETFGNATAETVERWLDPERFKYAGKHVTESEWYRSVPAPKKPFKWSLRDNTNYMETGVLAALDYAAKHGREMLRNFWRRGRNAVEKGRSESPFAIAIPEDQTDRGRLASMINLLRAHGIEVSRARAPFTTKEGNFAAGTFLVKLDQPYSGYAKDLLLPQKFPIEKTTWEPYDDVGWALPVAFELEARSLADPIVKSVETELVSAEVAYPGGVTGAGPVFLLRDTGQVAILAARARLKGFTVEAAEAPFTSGGVSYPAGSWVIPAQAGLTAALETLAGPLGLRFESAPAAPDVKRHSLDMPRLGVLQTWNDTQGPGWVRMLLDEEKVPYTLVTDDVVRKGDLLARLDVLLYPHSQEELAEMVNGMDVTFSPLAYTKTAAFPSHGTPASSPDVTGGLGWRGVSNIDEFVRNGGLLVTLGGASTLALDGGIAKDVYRPKVKDVDAPGSQLRARFRRYDHPIAYGYKEHTSVFREELPIYGVRRADRGRVVLQYGSKLVLDPALEDPDEKKDEKSDGAKKEGEGAGHEKDESAKEAEKYKELVVSGGIKGASEIAGKPAILDLPTGKGRVLAFDFDPIHRAQTQGTFRLVWNAILNWNDLPR
jgi:hypothetical protein